VSNSGTSATGATQMTAGLNWGNALWRGDLFNFSYTTGTDLGVLHQYSAAYTVNLSPRHQVTVNGSYSHTQPVSAPGSSALGSIGTMANVSPRYVWVVPAAGGWSGQLSAGFDWKRTNNNLLFGGQSVFTSSASIEQFSIDYAGNRSDARGSTSGDLMLVFSPGGLTAGNSDAAFAAQRQGATARYVYARLSVERATSLSGGFVWDVRGTGQIADAPLLSSEELILGGEGSVRGFQPFAAARDEGFILTMELRAPALHPNLPRRLGMAAGDGLSAFAFVDYGLGRQHGLAGTLLQLTSVGPGARYQFARYASVALSYGFIVQHAGLPTSSTGRVQVQVSVNY
ncbi:MAG: ShlB/FhaC/HecB family hemolysin secretion/activation protein, partial [Acidobacteriota bacterium]|nr:ShlB/FhaC/HecB family hemolysin secretion/activation protein [Acidobacteriota bacterium]